MEDAFATVPRFMKIPLPMLIGDRVLDGLSRRLSHLTTHFFGVYDGHGGSQVSVSLSDFGSSNSLLPKYEQKLIDSFFFVSFRWQITAETGFMLYWLRSWKLL